MIAANGYILRPLVANVLGNIEGGEVVPCGNCGQDCWKRPALEPEPLPTGYTPVCTECGLKLSVHSGKVGSNG